MDTATQNLENDHVFIIRLTEIILAMVQKQSVDTAHFELVINLIRNFADGTHHSKEEGFLFPLLGEKGFSPEFGPVAVMLNEHEEGRTYVKAAAAAIQDYKSGNKAALQTIYDNLEGYAYLLQNHIDKENNILFRMADEAFSSAEQQNMIEQFVEVENKVDKEFNPENSKLKIETLAGTYLP
jgi:hemerythrin-like domain-containing protein